MSDGDSDKSDEEAEETIDHLSRLVLSAIAKIAQEEEDDDEFTVEQPKSKRKRLQKWIQKDRQASDIEQGKLISPSKEASSSETPQQFFELFFDEELLTNIAFQTNLYASQKNKTLGVTVNELKVFIGGILLSAICPLPNKTNIGLQEIMFPNCLPIAHEEINF